LPYLSHVRHAFLIGEAANAFETEISGKVPVTQSGDLETALRDASARAAGDVAPSPVILLSPACASFDQYRNFALRGDHFRDLVYALRDGGAA
jgi:UDP-N-acetylmuramoylalanine--D-glutamate ligase